MLLIRNAEIYAPKYQGKGDVLICGEKIEWMAPSLPAMPGHCRELDARGRKLAPGILDCHVHITGGGGEGGFSTRAPEVALSALTKAGVTTVLGLLGTDGLTRSAENLYAKTRALNEEGITAYMLTGAYGYPGPSVTGKADRDLAFIREVLGVKLALSDHRAPHITLSRLISLASEIRVAGMVSGKEAGLVLHMGDAKSGLEPVFQALEESALPAGLFRPTHINRNPHLLEEGYRFLEKGGAVDLTCGLTGKKTPGDCVLEAKEKGLPLERITFSSDGQGSWSSYGPDGSLLEMGVSRVDTVFREIRSMVTEKGMSLEEALPYGTSNPAKIWGLFPKKGCIREGADADLLLLDENLEIDTVIARGQVMVQDKKVVKWGNYEEQ